MVARYGNFMPRPAADPADGAAVKVLPLAAIVAGG